VSPLAVTEFQMGRENGATGKAPPAFVDPFTVFIERADARAYLVAIGDMTAREAISGLQQALESAFLEIEAIQQ
jgi:hypothetical protein